MIKIEGVNMKKTLNDFKYNIMKLPLKEKYTKEELLTEDFLIDREGILKYIMHHTMSI